MKNIRVIGAGLAGSELSLQLANAGFEVLLYEMKPHKKTPAQKLDGFAELVCSNSFRSIKPSNAVGLLKEEMRIKNSFLMRFADMAKVPAGDALAVDREIFSSLVEKAVLENPRIKLIREEYIKLDDSLTVIATGPLTSDLLTKDLIKIIEQENLAFYDAIAPIVDAQSIDMNEAFFQSRHQSQESNDDYLNCPLNKNEYELFIKELLLSEKAELKSFEDARYFEGCLPIEVMAERGVETLRFGPFKPVGLFDQGKNERPYAVLQLRKEDIYGSSYNMVGCQTRMKIKDQERVFSLIPALKNIKFMRYGSLHRNTYVDSPKVLSEYLSLKNAPNIFLAGQITGVEGYVESIACALIVAEILMTKLKDKDFKPFPKETALGGLYNHILGKNKAREKDAYVPSNITWAMIPPIISDKKLGRLEQRLLMNERAIMALKEHQKNESDLP